MPEFEQAELPLMASAEALVEQMRQLYREVVAIARTSGINPHTRERKTVGRRRRVVPFYLVPLPPLRNQPDPVRVYWTSIGLDGDPNLDEYSPTANGWLQQSASGCGKHAMQALRDYLDEWLKRKGARFGTWPPPTLF